MERMLMVLWFDAVSCSEESSAGRSPSAEYVPGV
jgi:hypothetical protein